MVVNAAGRQKQASTHDLPNRRQTVAARNMTAGHSLTAEKKLYTLAMSHYASIRTRRSVKFEAFPVAYVFDRQISA